jgi:hypothetical protein
MVKAKKERKSYLNKIAKSGVVGTGSRSQYLKYSDINPSDVHEGTVTYRDVDYTDSPSTNLNTYRLNVHRGTGKEYFRFQGKLYQVTGSGTSHSEVQT